MTSPKISFDSPHLTPLKENNFQYKPTPEQILSYAVEVLELNPLQDPDLIYLAEQALIAPLPQNWQPCEYFPDENGYNEENGQITEEETLIVYRNKLTKQVVYDHPLDSLYRQKARQLKLMKNTAKYSQNVTPISEQMIESSVLFQKKTSKKGDSESMENNSSSNNFSSNFEESKSKLFNQVNSKTSDLVRNITEESLPYDEEEGEFENLSMVTDKEDEGNFVNEISQIKVGNWDKIKKKSFGEQNVENRNKKVDMKKLKDKPKVIRPIIIPSEQQIKKKREKQTVRRQAYEARMRQMIQKTLLQQLAHIHKQKMTQMSKKVTSSITLKQVQQQAVIYKQFPESCSNKIKSGVELLNKKSAQLKLLERQSKAMDDKIQQLVKIIQFQSKL